jgi:NAD(P)H-hydrate epimerase
MRLTREQVRTIDRLASERYGIPAVVLMENAARAVAEAAKQMIGPKPSGVVIFLCGGGNNGGDGMAAARHLHNAGVSVEVMLTADPSKYVGEAMTNWQIVKAMKLPTGRGDFSYISRQKPALIVDAIFGTGLTEPPRQPFQELLDGIEKCGAPILAVDIPSGMDCDRGVPAGVGCIKAKRTVTFVAEKIGFASPSAKQYTGEVTVGDIGCPRELIEETLRG